MKSNTPNSMKFKRLQRRLGTSMCQTVGMLELLWLATAREAPRGDIGRYSNEEIAIECDYDGDHDELVAALVDCGWLDQNDECRLVVHDWADHAPNHIRNNLKRWGKSFVVPGEDAKDPPMDVTKDPPVESPMDVTPSLAKPSQAEPSVTKPDLTKPNQSIAAAKAAECHFDFAALPVEQIGRAAFKLAKAIERRQIQGIDCDWVWKHTAIGELLKPGLIADFAARVAESRIKKPRSYLEKALRDECEAVGLQVASLAAQAPPIPNRQRNANELRMEFG